MADIQRPDSTTTSSSTVVREDFQRTTSGKARCWRVSELERTTFRKPLNCSTSTTERITPALCRPQTAVASTAIRSPSPSSFLFRPRSNMVGKVKNGEEKPLRKTDFRSVSVLENNYNRTELIERLRQEIDDLTLALEEEKLSHKESKQSAVKKLKSQTVHLVQQHSDNIRQMNDDVKNKMSELQASFGAKMENCARERDENIEKLRIKLATVQSAFEIYKINLEKETEEKFNEKVTELRQQLQVKVERESEVISLRIANDTSSIIVQREGRFLEEFKLLKKANERQKEEVLTRAFLHATDTNKLKTSEARVKELEAEIETLDVRINNACNQLDTTKQTSTSLQKKLKMYEESLESRLQSVDDKYRSRIDELNAQINQMHLLYINKSKAACDEQAKMDAALFERANSAKHQLQASIDMRRQSSVTSSSNARRSSVL